MDASDLVVAMDAGDRRGVGECLKGLNRLLVSRVGDGCLVDDVGLQIHHVVVRGIPVESDMFLERIVDRDDLPIVGIG